MKCMRRIEKAVLRFLKATINTDFFCDSKPRLCIHCKRLRFFLKFWAIPNFMVINTYQGLYVWHGKGVEVFLLG